MAALPCPLPYTPCDTPSCIVGADAVSISLAVTSLAVSAADSTDLVVAAKACDTVMCDLTIKLECTRYASGILTNAACFCMQIFVHMSLQQYHLEGYILSK